ncbi:hypothetical protein K456DRAFT_54389 [Colletotrichum gloeosporioides 23]|nr:hypothetical protein K456DRAFT_54389 [Colletotrichum gloeosporioides 23]
MPRTISISLTIQSLKPHKPQLPEINFTLCRQRRASFPHRLSFSNKSFSTTHITPGPRSPKTKLRTLTSKSNRAPAPPTKITALRQLAALTTHETTIIHTHSHTRASPKPQRAGHPISENIRSPNPHHLQNKTYTIATTRIPEPKRERPILMSRDTTPGHLP